MPSQVSTSMQRPRAQTHGLPHTSLPAHRLTSPETQQLALSERPHQQQLLARALGWFSVGLGLSELLLPRQLARAIGVDAPPLLVRLLGARELVNGLAILGQQRPGPAVLYGRVVGDAIDLGLLASAWSSPRSEPARLAASTAAVLGVSALDVLCSRQLSADPTKGSPLELRATIAVQRSPDELYRFWRELENLPRVFSHMAAIERQTNDQFVVHGKQVLGRSLSWSAQITQDLENRSFEWESQPGAPLPCRGRIDFTPLDSRQGADRGTLLGVVLRYEPSWRGMSQLLTGMFGDTPNQLLKHELRRFKQWVETGEIPTTQGQPSGRRSLLGRHAP